MRGRRRATAGLAVLLIAGCGSSSSDTADFGARATHACADARSAADAAPEQTPDLLAGAAAQLKDLAAPPSQRAAASALVTALDRQRQASAQLSRELQSASPDRARVARLQAAVVGERRSIQASASALGARGCDAITATLLRRARTAASTPAAAAPMTRAAYRRLLQQATGDVARSTRAIQAATAAGTLRSDMLTGYADGLGRIADRLASVTPPADAADAHDALVEGVRGLRTTMATAARQLHAGHTTRGLQTVQRFSTSATAKALVAAGAELRRHHYLE